MKLVFILSALIIFILCTISVIKHTYRTKEKISYQSDYISVEKLNIDQNKDIIENMNNAENDSISKAGDTFLPNGLGTNKGGTPMEVSFIPGTDKKLGVYVRDPKPTKGRIMDKSNNFIQDIELLGEPYKNTNSIRFVTNKVLLVYADLISNQPGIFRSGLLQYDFNSKKLDSILTEDIEKNNSYILPFSENQSLLIYYSGADVYSPPTERVIRIYNEEYPKGLEVLHYKYPQGFISKYFWQNNKTIYLLTNTNTLYKVDFHSSIPVAEQNKELNLVGNYSYKILNGNNIPTGSNYLKMNSVLIDKAIFSLVAGKASCTGEINDSMQISDKNGYFDKNGCKIEFLFDNSSVKVSEKSDCSYYHGAGCTFNGHYLKQ